MATNDPIIRLGTQVYDTAGVLLGHIQRDVHAGDGSIWVHGGLAPRVLPIGSIGAMKDQTIVLRFSADEFLHGIQPTESAGAVVNPNDLMGTDDPEFQAMGRNHVKAAVAGKAIDQRVSLAKADTDAAFDDTIDRIVATKKKVDAAIAAHPSDEQLARILRQVLQQKAENLVKMDNATAERRYVMAAEDIRENIPPPRRPEPEPIIIEQRPYRAPAVSPYPSAVHQQAAVDFGMVFMVVVTTTIFGIIIAAIVLNR